MNKYYEYKQGRHKIVFIKVYDDKDELELPELFKKSNLVCYDKISIECLFHNSKNISIEKKSLTTKRELQYDLKIYKATEIYDFEYNSMTNLIIAQAERTEDIFNEIKANLRNSNEETDKETIEANSNKVKDFKNLDSKFGEILNEDMDKLMF
ncbi:MAG: hypothetical protein J1F35_06655 [Erysipelotrichales bacterium]|nr:hypothetical protein [Erysipelotrichales bacterium]